MTVPIFRLWAKLMRGRAEELYDDMMLAATAAVHGLTMATRNVRHFADVGILIRNPFEHAKP
jgi:predicted nucleic acid-binding protein